MALPLQRCGGYSQPAPRQIDRSAPRGMSAREFQEMTTGPSPAFGEHDFNVVPSLGAVVMVRHLPLLT
jgi:hypothetical protein